MAQEELIALAQEKLQQLQTALILETDTAVKFKLKHEIQALKAQIQVFGGNPDGLLNENMHNQIDNNQIIGNNNKIQVIIYSWRWWGLGVVGGVVFIFVLGKFSSNDQLPRFDNGYCNAFIQDNKTANVSIVCGVDPKIHQKTQDEKSELEKKLHTQYKEQIAYLKEKNVLVDKVRVAEEVIKNYKELQKANANLQTKADIIKNYNKLQKALTNLQTQVNTPDEHLSQLLAEAQTALSAADLEEAKQTLDKLLAALESVEKQIYLTAAAHSTQALVEKKMDLYAAAHFARARVALANFKPNEAYPHLKKAYELRSKNFEYAITYADTLRESPRDHRDRNTAILTYQTILNWLRPLAEKDKARLPDVATTLNNLANLFSNDTSRRSEAEQYYQEALKIRRELADKQPEVYRPDVAMTLNNLANLFSNDTSRRSEAEPYYQEALEIRRELADKQPAVYRPDVAMTLNNLAVLFANDTSRRSEAEQYYQEALKIRRELADKQPAVYRPDVATTLNNLALLFSNDTNRRSEAEQYYQEALKIRRELADKQPAVYRSNVATTLNNLANLLKNDINRLAEALSLITEAIEINTMLNQTAPTVFGDDLARSFGILGLIQMKAGKIQASCEAWRKAYDVSQTMALKERLTTLLKKNCSK